MPDNDDARIKLADLALRSYLRDPGMPSICTNRPLLDRKLPEAVEQFRTANLVRPMQAEVVLALGQTLVRNNQSVEAEQLAREAIAKDKTFDAAYRILYGILMSSGRTAEAEVLLKSLVEASPTTERRLRFPKETPLCNLYLSMLHCMGMEEESFGDSKGVLPWLG